MKSCAGQGLRDSRFTTATKIYFKSQKFFFVPEVYQQKVDSQKSHPIKQSNFPETVCSTKQCVDEYLVGTTDNASNAMSSPILSARKLCLTYKFLPIIIVANVS